MSTSFRPRYGLLLIIAAIVGCANESEDTSSVQPYNTILMRSMLDIENGEEIQMREILFAPGWKAPRHYHNSDLFIYVIAGEFEVDMEDGDEISVSAGPWVGRFVRLQEKNYFYRTLIHRLGWPQTERR